MAYIQEKVKGSERSFPIIFCQLNDKLEFVDFPVIANQYSDWCGNPPVRRTTSRGWAPENGTLDQSV